MTKPPEPTSADRIPLDWFGNDVDPSVDYAAQRSPSMRAWEEQFRHWLAEQVRAARQRAPHRPAG